MNIYISSRYEKSVNRAVILISTKRLNNNYRPYTSGLHRLLRKVFTLKNSTFEVKE